MKKIQIPVTRPDPDPVSENEDDSYDEEIRDPRSSRGGPSASRRHEKSWVRDRSASRERSLSPRSDRRSVTSSQPAKPTKVTLVKSRKNEGNLWGHLLLKLLLVFKGQLLHSMLCSRLCGLNEQCCCQFAHFTSSWLKTEKGLLYFWWCFSYSKIYVLSYGSNIM